MRERKIAFLFLNQNICCGYGSLEHPKHMLKIMGKQVRKYLQFYAENFHLSKPVDKYYHEDKQSVTLKTFLHNRNGLFICFLFFNVPPTSEVIWRWVHSLKFHQADLYSLYVTMVTLKIRSRSPKPNQLFIYAH